jgi:hypothetical protein
MNNAERMPHWGKKLSMYFMPSMVSGFVQQSPETIKTKQPKGY